MLRVLLLLLSITFVQASTVQISSSGAYLEYVKATTVISYECIIERKLNNTLFGSQCLELGHRLAHERTYDRNKLISLGTVYEQNALRLFISLTASNVKKLNIVP